jgi:hypothetical protein
MTKTVFAEYSFIGLSQDGACTDLIENLSKNNIKGDLSNAATLSIHLFSQYL